MTAQNRPNMLQAALRHVERGLYIFPANVPIFDKNGNYTGCTCEHNKRSESYHQLLIEHKRGHEYDPNYKCLNPGKCPAVSWAKKSTNDKAQINKWWGKQWRSIDVETDKPVYFYPNIGIDCGKSGLLVLDEDAYKKVYGDLGDLLTPDEQETVKQLSGSHKGSHLLYKRPEGKTYGNATGDLPKGIDIRGVGGYIIAEPSLHKSGNRYEWLEGYSPDEIELQTVPEALQVILDQAYVTSSKGKAIEATFTTVATERPDLIQWHISKDIRELIYNPPSKGGRSEADYSVALSLVYAGASDDEIRAVFQHYPIGDQGKYAESGDQYLAHTIGNARTWATAHPRPDVRATLTNLMLWARTHSFEQFINPQLISSDGIYRTDANDTKVAIAILMLMCTLGRLTINIGKKRLAKLAGIGSCNTVLAALERLSWLFGVTSDSLQGMQITLDLSRLQQFDPHIKDCIVIYGDQFSKNDNAKPPIDEYSPRMAAEPFLVGVSKLVRERIQELAKALDIPPAQAKEEYTFVGLGESGLRVIDALLRAGDMTAAELAAETGKKVSSIRTAVRKLTQHGMVEAEREGSHGPKVYSLAPDVWQRIEEVAPNLRTYTATAQRENKRLKDAQHWCDRGIAQAKAAQDAEKAKHLEQRKAKLAAQRLPHLVRLLEGKASQAEIKEIAYKPTLPFGPHPATQAKLNRLHGQARMDLAEQRHKAQWETARLLSENIAALKASNTPKREWFSMLTLAGFTPNEAKQAIKFGGAA